MVYHTNNKLSDIVIDSEDIGNAISDLDLNEAHEHDMTSIHKLKMCGDSIHKPLEYTSWASLSDEPFSIRMEKGQCSANSQKRWLTNLEKS